MKKTIIVSKKPKKTIIVSKKTKPIIKVTPKSSVPYKKSKYTANKGLKSLIS